jgi:hypothetical protein
MPYDLHSGRRFSLSLEPMSRGLALHSSGIDLRCPFAGNTNVSESPLEEVKRGRLSLPLDDSRMQSRRKSYRTITNCGCPAKQVAPE